MKKKFWPMLTLALPYVITVFLPVISVLCLGVTVLNNFNEKIVTEKQVSIETAFERFLQKIDAAETLAYTIAQNDVMTKYTCSGLNQTDHTVVDCMEMKDLLSSLMVNNDVAAMYYYDRRDNRIISNDTALSDAAVFFKFAYMMDGYTPEESVEQLKSLSWGNEYSSSMKVTMNAKETEVIEYRISMPLAFNGNIQGQLVLVMETADIFDDFNAILNDNGEFYIYNNEDKLIYGSGEMYEELLDLRDISDLKSVSETHEKVYGLVRRSGNNLWKVKVYLPNLLETGSTGAVTPYFWLLVVMPVVVSMILCIYFTHKNHKEIMDTLKLFRGQDEAMEKDGDSGEEVGYKIIREYAGRIISENNRFKERITSYEYSRKYELLDKLVRNTYGNREEIEKELADTELQILCGKCIVLCIRYEGSYYRTIVSDGVTIKDFVRELLGQLIERQYEIFDTSARDSICVLSIDDNENTEVILRDIISRLNVEIAYSYGIEVKIGAGDVVDSIYSLSDSYQQAKAVIRYIETSGNKVCLYSEILKLEDVYYYPREFDEKIYNYVVVGKVEEAKDIIRKIYKDNFEDNIRMLSVRAIEIIKSRLMDCVISMSDKYDISIDNILSQLRQEQNVKSYFDIVYDTVTLIAEEISNKKKTVQNHSALKIMSYINENYCDNTLSMKQISQTFGFHENYVSNLFKAEYGENISVVIEKLRIEKACDLIKNTDMKIADIAEMVGYTSDKSFRRAFKKIIGVSPVEYRG